MTRRWFDFLFRDPVPRPRPLVVPDALPTPEAIDPIPTPTPREREDGLPHMSIDAP